MYSPGLADAGIHVPMDRDGDSQKTHPFHNICSLAHAVKYALDMLAACFQEGLVKQWKSYSAI